MQQRDSTEDDARSMREIRNLRKAVEYELRDLVVDIKYVGEPYDGWTRKKMLERMHAQAESVMYKKINDMNFWATELTDPAVRLDAEKELVEANRIVQEVHRMELHNMRT
jgi:hypothetical protein